MRFQHTNRKAWWHMFGWNVFGALCFGPMIATHRFFNTLNKIETELNRIYDAGGYHEDSDSRTEMSGMEKEKDLND